MTAAADELGARLRPLMPKGVEEKRMFGGLGFLVAGNMAIGTTAAGDLLVRADPTREAETLALPGAYRMMMGERAMKGFIAVHVAALTDDTVLRGWVERGFAYARTLPAK